MRETELGELRKVESKGEARRRALRRYYVHMCEAEILDALTRKAAEDITAAEDSLFLETIETTLAALQVTSEAPPQ